MPRLERQFTLQNVMILVIVLAFVFASLRSEGGTCLLTAILSGWFSVYCINRGAAPLLHALAKHRRSFRQAESTSRRIRIGFQITGLSVALILIGWTILLISALITLSILMPISSALRR